MTANQNSGVSASPLILCTNDDGVHAPGLRLLADVAGRLGHVSVVAPDRQQSATSHSLTLHRPLRVTEIEPDRHVIDGTPTDCVLIAVNQLLRGRPDFVLSGVNHGPNMGEDVLYSGTVAAAMEATILGIPAIAVSWAGEGSDDLSGFAGLLHDILNQVFGRSAFPPETFLNINIPDVAASSIKGIRVTTLGRRVYSDSLIRREDPGGREYFWIGGGVSSWSGGE
ncbi:MAG: 5'/3'-nucleotidase SurE, partial [Gemmatimonadota bacterium]